jgi:uncharacterized protein YjbI with pentapeptide repeats
MRCKYIYKNEPMKEQCEREAEPGPDYCFWHEPTDKKNLERKKITERNLREAYLVRAFLSGAEFEEKTNLSYANLQGADLGVANLQEADLAGANLQEADLAGANLQEADLAGANLQGADLAGANLQGANLRVVKLQEANLRGANLQEADLTSANLQEADLIDANLQGADLTSANLQEADLRDANLQGADLTSANLQEANLTSANLQEANLFRANLEGAFLFNAFLKGAKYLRSATLGEKLIDEAIGDTLLKLQMPIGEFETYKKNFLKEIKNLMHFNEDLGEIFKWWVWQYVVEELKSGYGRNYIFKKSEKFYEKVANVYLNLKNYFRDDGAYDLSGKYFIEEFRVKGKIYKVNSLLSLGLLKNYKKHLLYKLRQFIYRLNPLKNEVRANNEIKESPIEMKKSLPKIIKDLLENFFDQTINETLNLTSRYGESPLRVIVTAISIVLFYAVIYMICSGVVTSSNSLPKSALDYVYFSVQTFVTLNYGEFVPAPKMRLVAGSEAFLGAFIIAYFVVVVSRKIMR